MIERRLQCGGIVGRKISDGAETTVLHADRLVIVKQEHRSRHHQAAVLMAVQVVPPSVLM